MSREISTGAYWFYRRDLDRCAMELQLALRENIDGAALQTAADRVREQLPFLNYTRIKSEDGSRYLLTENDAPFSVRPNPGFSSLEAPENGGFLWSLAFWEKRFYLRLFHGLCDGLGLVEVTRQLLLRYFALVKEDVDLPVLRSPDGSEYADPFAFARPWDRSFPFRVPPAFQLQPESLDSYVPRRRLLSLSLEEVLAVSRQNEGSVSGILSLLLARAVDSWREDKGDCVVVKCPINLRPMLGCEGTMQNCVSSVQYVFSEKLRSMPFPRQASCFKGMLMIQSSEEYQMNRFHAWKQEMLRFNREGSIQEKRAVMAARAASVPMVSYLGSFSLGACDRYLESVNIAMELEGGIGIVALCFGDRLVFNLMLSEKNSSFLPALTGELEKLGIAFTWE